MKRHRKKEKKNKKKKQKKIKRQKRNKKALSFLAFSTYLPNHTQKRPLTTAPPINTKRNCQSAPPAEAVRQEAKVAIPSKPKSQRGAAPREREPAW
jgi:hypothetical protein